MSEQSQKTCGQCFSPDRSQEKSTCPTLTEKVKRKMFKIRKGQVQADNMKPKRNDSTEGVRPGQEHEESLGEYSTEKSNGQNNMGAHGLPSSFLHRRTGEKETFECNLCNVILTSFANKDEHMNGKRHLAKQNKLRQQNSDQEIQSVIGVQNPSSAKLNKVMPINMQKPRFSNFTMF